MAHQIGRWFRSSEALMVVTVVTGFSEAEIDLFLDLRRYYGDERWIDGVPGGATPGQLFNDSPRENRRTVTEYLFLLMAFNFEGYFVEADTEAIVWSGDEIMEIHCRQSDRTEALRRFLADLGIEFRTYGT